MDSTFESGCRRTLYPVWIVDDIINALQLGVGPFECRNLFAAGAVADRAPFIGDFGAFQQTTTALNFVRPTS